MDREHNKLSHILHLPVGDVQDTRRKLLNILLVALAAWALLALAGRPAEAKALYFGTALTLLGTAVIYALNRYVSTQTAGTLLLLLLLIVAALSDEPRQVVDGRGLLVFAAPILAAGILLRPWASFVAAGLSGVAISFIGLTVEQMMPSTMAIATLAVLAVMSYLAARSLERTAEDLDAAKAALQEYVPHFDGHGQVKAFLGLIEDITERKRAEEALRFEKEFSDSILDTVVETIFVFDPSTGRPTRWNKAFNELSGYTDQEIRSMKAPYDWYDERDIEKTEKETAKLLRGEKSIVEMSLITKDGKKIPTEYTASMIHGSEGHPQYIIAVGRDITGRKHAEQALKAYSERLEEMVEARTQELQEAQEQLVRREKLAMLGQLAGGVGHELRNPLGVISNAVYYLKMILSDPDETIHEHLEMIASQVHSADKIIADLLDFSHTRPAEREEIAVSALVAQVLEKCPPPEEVQVLADIATDLPAAFIDPRQIEMALANLITNAYQAMPEGGKLTISARTQEDRVALSIADTGRGISSDNMKKLFEPLFTTKARGIGLGLAVSKNLVEANEGIIVVESEAGAGTTFWITLPTKEITS